ncbi:MAG: response regulator transcription factor [Dehalococcoidia bacterium]|nr:response regulator transcription factor [Dehalococcoidia bacterium]
MTHASAFEPITVLVLAAYPSARAGLAALLAGEPGIAVVAQGAWPPELDAAYAPAAVIVAEAGDDAATAAAALDEAFPGVPAVLLGEWTRVQVDGAPRGYLSRDATAEELAAAVRAVHAGLTVLGPGIRAAAPGATEAAFSQDTTLTEREREVLVLLAAGLPNKGIALQLGISEHTAKFHVGTILSKLGAASRTEAVMVAARRGLLPL